MELPNIIQQFIGNSVLEPNKIGQSPSDVYSFNRNNETFFLKRSSTLIQRPHTVSLVKRKC